jgi:diaminohydroxyphosphoribosylaminopyrimidine deaminase/5-amino-6-(5-phosphoribosylamino)uracil reductase
MGNSKLERWDADFMSLCLSLARQAEGRTSPNPHVGAIVVDKSGEVVGKGYHPAAGEPHAEVFALDEAGSSAEGGTIYVNLEPCNHHGRTPPCTEKILASGVKRVVVGIRDPHELVNGSGLKRLEEAGLQVTVGIHADECTWLNRAFIKSVTSKMPWVILKMATTLDGKIADRFGKSRWITGPDARQYVHELRNKVDCVLVGTKTVLLDDPALNVRDIAKGRNPARAIIDSKLVVPRKSRVFRSDTGGKTHIFCNSESAEARRKELSGGASEVASESHVEYHEANALPDSALMDLGAVLRTLAAKGHNTVLCEGGGQLAASLLQGGLIDEVHWLLSPKILGDLEGSAAVSSSQPVDLSDALQLYNVRYAPLGEDVLVHGVTKAHEGYRLV